MSEFINKDFCLRILILISAKTVQSHRLSRRADSGSPFLFNSNMTSPDVVSALCILWDVTYSEMGD